MQLFQVGRRGVLLLHRFVDQQRATLLPRLHLLQLTGLLGFGDDAGHRLVLEVSGAGLDVVLRLPSKNLAEGFVSWLQLRLEVVTQPTLLRASQQLLLESGGEVAVRPLRRCLELMVEFGWLDLVIRFLVFGGIGFAACLVFGLLEHGVVVNEEVYVDALVLWQVNLAGGLGLLVAFARLRCGRNVEFANSGVQCFRAGKVCFP